MRQITDLKEIQEISLNILKYIDKICKENDIKYSLDGGTLLGAIRHKGFIPWDDDIDIMMTRENYNKFLEVMDKQKNKQFKCLHFSDSCLNYFYRYAKVVDLTTSLIEDNYIQNKDMGIFVDIFPFDVINLENLDATLKTTNKYSNYLSIAGCKKLIKSNSKIKHFIKCILKPFFKMMGCKHWLSKYEKTIKKMDYDSYDHLIAYAGIKPQKTILPKSYFDNIIEVEFERLKFPAIKEYDIYLTNLYGDYMIPPPKEKQVSHHSIKIYRK